MSNQQRATERNGLAVRGSIGRRRFWLVTCAGAMVVAAATFGNAQEPSKKCLLVDDRFVEKAEGVQRVLHPLKRHPNNPLIVQDKPWECAKGFRYYPSVCMWSNPVLRDPQTGRFRMWYSGYVDFDEQQRGTGLLMYAESDDGLTWRKPNLGLVTWHGSKQNNIVLAGAAEPGAPCRILDTCSLIYRPEEPEPANRYRLLASLCLGPEQYRLPLYRSEDGLHWEQVAADAVPGAREFNCFYWDEQAKKYRGTVRSRTTSPSLPRQVSYLESDDCLHWTPGECILRPGQQTSPYNLPGDDCYGLISFPYESHYLGFFHNHHADRRLEVQLMTSDTGRDWRLAGDGRPILPTDPPGGPGQGMMSTMNTTPIRVGDELWVYIGIAASAHSNPKIQPKPGQHKRTIGLATLRVDGFASYQAGQTEGSVLTKPISWPGKTLKINAAVQPGGYLKAALVGPDGHPLPGYSADECVPFTGDSLAATIGWKARDAVPSPLPEGTRIRYFLKCADLYAFWAVDGYQSTPSR
jgi:hypothetical protein